MSKSIVSGRIALRSHVARLDSGRDTLYYVSVNENEKRAKEKGRNS